MFITSHTCRFTFSFIVRIDVICLQETVQILQRPAPGDLEYLDRERRLRCRLMFPTIYQDSTFRSGAKSVFVSTSANDLMSNSSTIGTDSDDGDLTFQELLSLWGGMYCEHICCSWYLLFLSNSPLKEQNSELNN